MMMAFFITGWIIYACCLLACAGFIVWYVVDEIRTRGER